LHLKIYELERRNVLTLTEATLTLPPQGMSLAMISALFKAFWVKACEKVRVWAKARREKSPRIYSITTAFLAFQLPPWQI